MGVEFNRFNKPEAFWIFQGPDHPYDDLSYGVNKPGRVGVPASDMLHIYLPERNHQSRAVPMFACVKKALHQLDGYMEAELIASRLAKLNQEALLNSNLRLKSNLGILIIQ